MDLPAEFSVEAELGEVEAVATCPLHGEAYGAYTCEVYGLQVVQFDGVFLVDRSGEQGDAGGDFEGVSGIEGEVHVYGFVGAQPQGEAAQVGEIDTDGTDEVGGSGVGREKIAGGGDVGFDREAAGFGPGVRGEAGGGAPSALAVTDGAPPG